MSVRLGRTVIARSDEAVILFEPARYPVVYFPIGDVEQGVLRPADHESTHRDLGKTAWFDVLGGNGEIAKCGAWLHVGPPPQAAALRDAVAFLVLYESGFAPRRYVPRADIVAVGDARTAAWSYRARFEEVARITTLVSFYPDLSVDEIGGIQLPEETIPAEA